MVYLWQDAMLLYANIRKATVKESYSLDAIANEELGKEKLDYTGYTIKNIPWKKLSKFFLYNVQDVNLLCCWRIRILTLIWCRSFVK